MKHIKKIICIIVCIVIGVNLTGCKKRVDSNLEETKDSYESNMEGDMKGFWLTNKMEEESIMLISSNGEAPCGDLLFQPSNILELELVTYNPYTKEQKVWIKGTNYKINGKTITAINDDLPFMTEEEVSGEAKIDGLDYSSIPSITGGLYLPFTEGVEFVSRQVYVTYEYDEKWEGSSPTYVGDKLPKSIEKLESKAPLNLLVYGDSISTGANSTGYMNVYPYKDSWPEVVTNNLSQYYKTEVNLLNKAVGGWTSENAIKSTESIGWVNGKEITSAGIKVTLEDMLDYKPDIVILGFGMNDATNGIDKNTYKIYMNKIISNIRERNSDCEFILLGTMLANPMALNQSKDQISYFSALEEIASNNKGIVAVNIGRMHQEMLDAGKKYIDMTGNNVNHPNDYMASIYAMNILALLTKE